MTRVHQHELAGLEWGSIQSMLSLMEIHITTYGNIPMHTDYMYTLISCHCHLRGLEATPKQQFITWLPALVNTMSQQNVLGIFGEMDDSTPGVIIYIQNEPGVCCSARKQIKVQVFLNPHARDFSEGHRSQIKVLLKVRVGRILNKIVLVYN